MVEEVYYSSNNVEEHHLVTNCSSLIAGKIVVGEQFIEDADTIPVTDSSLPIAVDAANGTSTVIHQWLKEENLTDFRDNQRYGVTEYIIENASEEKNAIYYIQL